MNDIEMIPVQSSNVMSIGYDEFSQILRVQFLNGGVYDYLNVPIHIFHALIEAPSKGTFLNHNVKNQFPHNRVG